MKRENHPIDDLFREALNDHPVAPSNASRSHFLEEASVGGIIKGTPRWPWLNIFLIAGFIGVAVVLYFLFLQKQETTPGVTAKEEIAATQTPVAIQPENKIKKPSTDNKQVNTAQNQDQQSIASINTDKTKSRNNSLDVKTRKPKWEEVDSPAQPVHSTNSQKNTETLAINGLPNPNTEIVSLKEPLSVITEPESSNTPDEAEVKPFSENDSLQDQPSHMPEDKNEGNNQPSPPGSSSPSVPKGPAFGFTPYLRYNIEMNLSNKDENLVHTLGIEGRMNYGKFYVQSGASFLIRNGQKNNKILLNEYLGNYKKLDSITFNWDQKQYHLLPTYHLSETEVFDSTVKQDEYIIQKQYRKVRIPVMLGYQVMEKGRFTLGVQSGFEWDLYLGSDEKSGKYEAGMNKVVSVDYLPDPLARNLVYWKSDFSIGCRINKRMILLAEPHIKYLLNPMESSSGADLKIWSPMIKGSVIIEF